MTTRPIGDGEAGSILPLVAAFAALALTLVLVAAAATSLYLERKRLLALADGAALAAAESFPLGGDADGAPPRPALTPAAVGHAVADYLADAAIGVDGLHIERAGTADGRTAAVTLSSRWRPPLLVPFMPEGLRIEVSATARAVFF